MNFLTQRVRPDKALARLSERVVAALIFTKRPGLLSHDASTGYRFAVTRWRSKRDLNSRPPFIKYPAECVFFAQFRRIPASRELFRQWFVRNMPTAETTLRREASIAS